MTKSKKFSRKNDILESIARMLETLPGGRITTASIAREVGVSEAALYRHFPSKAKMFEGLILFIEETLFVRINRIIAEEKSAEVKCQNILTLILTFFDRNPGMTRLLTGDVLAGETQRLRERISQFYNRLDSTLKQLFREAQIRENLETSISPACLSSLLLGTVEGRLIQFVRSEFKASPLEYWDKQWIFLRENMMQSKVSDLL